MQKVMQLYLLSMRRNAKIDLVDLTRIAFLHFVTIDICKLFQQNLSPECFLQRNALRVADFSLLACFSIAKTVSIRVT